MPLGYVYTHFFDRHIGIYVLASVRRDYYIHIGVGFNVARSSISGNARSL